MQKLHALTRILNLSMIAAIATLFVSLWVALITGRVVTSWPQIATVLAFLTPITCLLILPYVILLRLKGSPLASISQEWVALSGSLVLIALTAAVLTRPIYIPDLPFLGGFAVYLSPFALGTVQIVLAATTATTIRRIDPALTSPTV
jgi:hypothetical protein